MGNGSTTYSVVLRLSTEGTLAPVLQTVGERASKVDAHLRSAGNSSRQFGDLLAGAGERVGHALEGVADKALEVTTHLAKWGAVAGIGLATYGVAHLNQELENTQISLGAIAQAQGFSRTFEGGFRMAGDQLAKMKQDVKTLPGDLGQLSNIMKMIATPAAAGGANLDTIRALAGRTMLTSQILGVQQDVAAREMAGLLAGRAGSHNILGGRLGLIGAEAKKFNALSPEKRLERINAEMDKYKGAADAFGTSFVAQWTTLKDNIKYVLLAPVTAPLFEHVKRDLALINRYFDEHQAKIKVMVQLAGDRLVGAFDKIVSLVERVEPRLEGAADALLKMDPSLLISKFERMLTLFGELKVAGAGIRIGSSIIPGVLAGAGGRGGMVGGAGGIAGMLGEGAAVAGGLGAVPLGIALGTLAASAVAAGKGLDILASESSHYHMAAVDDAKRTADNLKALEPAAAKLVGVFTDLGDRIGSGFDRALRELSEHLALMLAPLSGHLPSGPIAHPLEQLSDSKVPPLPIREDPMDAWKSLMDQEKRKVPRGGNTYISKVEINVSSNADASRVARLAAAEVMKLKRSNPTSSPNVPRWDSTNPGY